MLARRSKEQTAPFSVMNLGVAMSRYCVSAVAIGCLLVAPYGESADNQPDYQRIADGQPWVWKGEQANLFYCVTEQLGQFDTVIECPKVDMSKPRRGALTVRMLDGGKEVYSFQAERETVFACDGRVIYFAYPERGKTGCSVGAYDFRDKKELWRSRLKSMTNLGHSAYGNEVTIEYLGTVLVVRGNESLLRYIEYVDLKTGKTLGQREYPRN
jgi:hypothetical protein